MATNTKDAGLLAKMFLAGAKNLEVKKEWINELNVFPVPDGDTGTNMTLTIMSVAALIFVPIVLAYQAWSVWVFRKRISTKNIPDDVAVAA